MVAVSSRPAQAKQHTLEQKQNNTPQNTSNASSLCDPPKEDNEKKSYPRKQEHSVRLAEDSLGARAEAPW